MTKSGNYTIIFSFLIFFYCFWTSEPLQDEVQALLDFKNQLNDPLGYLDSWKKSESPCRFYGVSCDSKTGLVIEISLDMKNLSGVISPSISMLKSLISLWIPSNALSGSLPNEIINCNNLRVLNVTGNNMNGTIPDLSGLISLEILDLSINYFSGKFPVWFGNLSGLVSLGLGENNFDEGEIPDVFGNLKKLTWLYLAGSNLTGRIPSSIFELESLGTLDVCMNQISGDFPKSINKLRNLWKIELYQNNLTGMIPTELAELGLLQEFDVSTNQLYGSLPIEIGNLKNLTVFHIFKNNFTGEFPRGFGDMQHLSSLGIYKNRFSGPFPENLGRFSPLNSLDISENQFSGNFPKYLCNKGNLQKLLAVENGFSGDFPDNYADCKPLQRLRINQNSFSGNIPNGLWALPSINMLDLSDNNFNGGIHPGIEFASNLNQLILTNNKFSGELPRELGKLWLLERLYLNNNSFSGPIPSELSGLKQISFLHLEENFLTGSIPIELSQCQRMVDLNMASNLLIGIIPESLASITSLNALNLSSNKLTGPIPSKLGSLKFSFLDLSNNHLSGVIPYDLLTMGGDTAFSGNLGLCINENPKIPINSKLNTCKSPDQKKVFKNKLLIFCLALSSVVAVLTGLLIISYLNAMDKEKHLDKTDPTWKLESFHPIEINADEISNLDEESLIGIGGTGKVYRLDLNKGYGTLAVKQLWKGNEVKVMTTEMEILGKIRHKNIVKLYACLTRGGSNFLVFEYMENGNLFQALHREMKGGKTELDWKQRYNIALGSAKGIAYLHHDCTPSILHRDIKSTNILLDEDYEAKIADFGVAKTVQVPHEPETGFTGTHGYLAPELAYSFKVTKKSDVYSFGVVLLELVTGKKPIDETYGEGKDIVYWVSTHLNDRESVLKVLDPKICCEENVEDDMIKVLRIAINCTTKLPNLRPNMKEIVKMLIDAEPNAYNKSIEKCDKNTKASV